MKRHSFKSICPFYSEIQIYYNLKLSSIKVLVVQAVIIAEGKYINMKILNFNFGCPLIVLVVKNLLTQC